MSIKDVAKPPELEPGMLVQYKDDSWMQLLSEYSKGTWLVNTLWLGSSGHAVVSGVMEGVNFDGFKNIKSVHWTECGDTKAVTAAQISVILQRKDMPIYSNDSSWYNPEYLPAKKMTVSEIEKELGYRVEVIAETE